MHNKSIFSKYWLSHILQYIVWLGNRFFIWSNIYVYIEQDLLIFGNEFLDKIFISLNENNKHICYLTGCDTPQPLQQSLVVVKHSYLIKLITGLIHSKNHTISEELKHFRVAKDDIMWCQYRGGRQRKNLDNEYYCLQHLSTVEIEKLKYDNKLINLFD